MSNVESNVKKPSFVQLIFFDGTPKKAFLTALVVGTILTTINHGDLMLSGEFPPLWKIFLTYCTPYCCLLYTSPSPRDQRGSRMPSSA